MQLITGLRIAENIFIVGGGGGGGGGGQGGCEWRSEAFVKIQKKKKFLLGGGGPVKGGGVRVDGNGELKLRCLLLLNFRSLAAIVSEKSTVFTFSYRQA